MRNNPPFGSIRTELDKMTAASRRLGYLDAMEFTYHVLLNAGHYDALTTLMAATQPQKTEEETKCLESA